MNGNPKFSVIIPVYNVENYLSRCLESVINQTLMDIEIICVNDGSKDGSDIIIKQYCRKGKWWFIISTQCGHENSTRGLHLLP